MDKLSVISEYKMKSPETKMIVNWWQLFPSHKIALEPNYQKEIFGKAIKKAGDYSALEKKINVPRKAISACYRLKRNPTIKYLIKIANYVEIPNNEINNKIIEIASLKNPKLPFDLNNPEGAEIIAAFLSDGHIPGHPSKNPMYCAYEKELHLRLISLCNEIFGDFKIKITSGNKSLLSRYPCPIGSALELAGVPRGNKGKSNSFLPIAILNGNKSVQTAYLRRVFDDEGHVCFSKSKKAICLSRSMDCSAKYSPVNLKSQKWLSGFPDIPTNNLILGEYFLLKELGIDAKLYPEGLYRSINKKTSAKWRIQIAQQDNLKLFAEKIGFNHTKKKTKLSQALKSYKRRKSSHGYTEKIIWRYVLQLSKRKNFITFEDIGKKLVLLNMTYDFAGTFLRKFLKDKRIRKIKRGVYVVNGDS